MKRTLLIVVALYGCSSSTSEPSTGIDGPSAADAPATAQADAPATPHADAPPGGGVDARPTADGSPGSADAAVQMVTLNIDNYLNWCLVTVGGHTYNAMSVPAQQVPKGTVVNLHADAETAHDVGTFVWGFWTGTDPGGKDTSKDTTVTMSADKNIQACCPFANDPTPSCP